MRLLLQVLHWNLITKNTNAQVNDHHLHIKAVAQTYRKLYGWTESGAGNTHNSCTVNMVNSSKSEHTDNFVKEQVL